MNNSLQRITPIVPRSRKRTEAWAEQKPLSHVKMASTWQPVETKDKWLAEKVAFDEDAARARTRAADLASSEEMRTRPQLKST